MDSIEALWTIQFDTGNGWINGGVVIFETGRVFGGDSQYFYTGTYQNHGDQISGEARIRHYHGPLSTAFGTNDKDFMVRLEGTRSRRHDHRSDVQAGSADN